MRRTVLPAIIAILLIALYACQSDKAMEKDRYIPRLHFTSGSGWTGEPAGLVYDDGEYHLFYQYNPADAMYGNIHWGHAVSRNLVEWQILPVALSPDSAGFLNSGSVVTDRRNTSGLGVGGETPFIAFYTYHASDGEPFVAMAYSLDKGHSWKKWDSPLLSPKEGETLQSAHVAWSEEYEKWIMTVSTGSSISFYASSDCRQWAFMSDFHYPERHGSQWEGSDFFPLPVEGTDQTKWILLVNMGNGPTDGASATRYFIGDFDGTSFRISQTKELWLDYGKDNYAGSTFNGLPPGNRISIGWMNCWEYANLLPTDGWRGSMTFPRSLSLVKEGKHYVLSSAPVTSLEAYSGKKHAIASKPVKLSDGKRITQTLPASGKPFIIRLKFDNKDNMAIWRARDYGIYLLTKSGKRLSVGYQNELSYYYIDRSDLVSEPFSDTFGQLMGATYRSEETVSDWQILIDHSSVELFADKGRIAMTALCYPDEVFSSLEIYSESGDITLMEASVTELNK